MCKRVNKVKYRLQYSAALKKIAYKFLYKHVLSTDAEKKSNSEISPTPVSNTLQTDWIEK